MTYKEFLEINSSLLQGKERENCLFSEIKDKNELFLYKGLYVLVDSNDEVVYIGSSYVRNLRSRLLQYQQKRNSGNRTLMNDLVEGNKTTKLNAHRYIKTLTIYTFEDESLEYKLIENTDGVVNIIGNSKKQK